MTAPLFSARQMEAIRRTAEIAMQEDVTILRRGDAPAPAPGEDYGDDALSFIETVESKRYHVKGWVWSTPTPVQMVDTGQIVTANTYMLRVPVGTDILPGDTVTIGENEYTVSDTTAENTWAPWLTCTLRHRE